MIGIDTNVLLRLLTEDDAAQAAVVQRLLAPVDAVPESVLINDIVLVETLWTLRRLYGYDRKGQVEVLGHLLSALTFRFEDRDVLSRAAQLFAESTADFSDCLIAAKNIRLGCESTATFDRSMASLAGGGVAEGLKRCMTTENRQAVNPPSAVHDLKRIRAP